MPAILKTKAAVRNAFCTDFVATNLANVTETIVEHFGEIENTNTLFFRYYPGEGVQYGFQVGVGIGDGAIVSPLHVDADVWKANHHRPWLVASHTLDALARNVWLEKVTDNRWMEFQVKKFTDIEFRDQN